MAVDNFFSSLHPLMIDVRTLLLTLNNWRTDTEQQLFLSFPSFSLSYLVISLSSILPFSGLKSVLYLILSSDVNLFLNFFNTYLVGLPFVMRIQGTGGVGCRKLRESVWCAVFFITTISHLSLSLSVTLIWIFTLFHFKPMKMDKRFHTVSSFFSFQSSGFSPTHLSVWVLLKKEDKDNKDEVGKLGEKWKQPKRHPKERRSAFLFLVKCNFARKKIQWYDQARKASGESWWQRRIVIFRKKKDQLWVFTDEDRSKFKSIISSVWVNV